MAYSSRLCLQSFFVSFDPCYYHRPTLLYLWLEINVICGGGYNAMSVSGSTENRKRNSQRAFKDDRNGLSSKVCCDLCSLIHPFTGAPLFTSFCWEFGVQQRDVPYSNAIHTIYSKCLHSTFVCYSATRSNEFYAKGLSCFCQLFHVFAFSIAIRSEMFYFRQRLAMRSEMIVVQRTEFEDCTIWVRF